MSELTDDMKLEVMNQTRSMLGQPILRYLGERDPRAVAKLTFPEQCEIMAFIMCGVPNFIIAAVFDIGERTVIRMKSPNPKSYPRVKLRLMQYSNEWGFCRDYITEKNEMEVIRLFPQFTRPEK